jgi:hypothetical protein
MSESTIQRSKNNVDTLLRIQVKGEFTFGTRGELTRREEKRRCASAATTTTIQSDEKEIYVHTCPP